MKPGVYHIEDGEWIFEREFEPGELEEAIKRYQKPVDE